VWIPNKPAAMPCCKPLIYNTFLVARQLHILFFVWHELNCEEDRNLIGRCQDGDEAAFKCLVDKYQRELFHLVSWNVGSAAEAEDIVQEVLCKVYFSLRKFDNDRPFYPWLRRVAINQCYDELRRVRRRKIVRFTELSEQETRTLDRVMATPQEDSSAPAPNNAEELRSLMQKVLDRLPEKQRMAIVLRDLKQVPYEEMAEIMKCSKQAVRLKVFRARARLRTLVTRALRRREKLSHGVDALSFPDARHLAAEAKA
jgi:RNA polymerase sigma-70 factor, ECF subfamily